MSENAHPSSRMGTILREIRKQPLFQSLIPAEAGIGWPAPEISRTSGCQPDGSVNTGVILPLFGMAPMANGQTNLYAPFAALTMEWTTARIVGFTDYRFRSPWQGGAFDRPIGVFPHPSVASLTRAEYLAKRRDLLQDYDIVLDTLASGGELPLFWVNAFGHSLIELIEPCFIPFYETIAPHFYRFAKEAMYREQGAQTGSDRYNNTPWSNGLRGA